MPGSQFKIDPPISSQINMLPTCDAHCPHAIPLDFDLFFPPLHRSVINLVPAA